MMRDKVTPKHLQQDAYLYIRQSSLRQVVEHSESTQRQYDLKERALALGWPLEQTRQRWMMTWVFRVPKRPGEAASQRLVSDGGDGYRGRGDGS